MKKKRISKKNFEIERMNNKKFRMIFFLSFIHSFFLLQKNRTFAIGISVDYFFITAKQYKSFMWKITFNVD